MFFYWNSTGLRHAWRIGISHVAVRVDEAGHKRGATTIHFFYTVSLQLFALASSNFFDPIALD